MPLALGSLSEEQGLQSAPTRSSLKGCLLIKNDKALSQDCNSVSSSRAGKCPFLMGVGEIIRS